MRRNPIPTPFGALLGALLLVAATGCAKRPHLAPAPPLEETEGRGDGAAVREADVTVEARAGAWERHPIDLHEELTPFFVRITNGSERPVRVRFQELRLEGGGDAVWLALPPYHIEGEVVAPADDAGRHAPGFAVAPHVARWYPAMSPYGGPFQYDPAYYRTYYAAYDAVTRVELPTEDMLVSSLPEGVVEPGGSVDGFVYFEKVPVTAERVVFHYTLVDARTGATFGEATIPFVTEE